MPMRVFSVVPLALVLSACAGSRPEAAGPTLTAPGTVLAYRVTDAPATYPFVVTVTQNDAAGTAFAYDLADGQSAGTVRMSAAARDSAPGGMLNAFGSEDYDLTDRTSVWMARDDARRLQAGEQVTIRDGEGGYTFEIVGCDMPFAVAGAGTVATCRYTSPADPEAIAAYRDLCDEGDADSCAEAAALARDGAAYIVALDDADEPLILDMQTAEFRVTLQGVE